MRVSHEPVNHVVRVQEKSGHCAVRSNAVDVRTLAWSRARARNVELNERAVPIAHETVIHIFLVSIPSRDRSIRIDSKRERTLEGTWYVTGVWRIEAGNNALIGTNVTVEYIDRVPAESANGPTRVGGVGPCPLARARARTR